LDPVLHPFEKAREYVRALNATKLERVFAKPFVASLSGHCDGVYCLAKSKSQLTKVASGSADGGRFAFAFAFQLVVMDADKILTDSLLLFVGPLHGTEVRLWDLAAQKTVWKAKGHQGFVRGVSLSPYDSSLVSVGDDKTVKLWNAEALSQNVSAASYSYMGKNAFNGVDHHRSKQVFATAGSSVDIWDMERWVF
jgi:WD repeat and SOF domain-containing protein 1